MEDLPYFREVECIHFAKAKEAKCDIIILKAVENQHQIQGSSALLAAYNHINDLNQWKFLQ